ncbi:MAG: hypothetical protein RR744_10675 [Cellulosilyticaceae bacterium]
MNENVKILKEVTNEFGAEAKYFIKTNLMAFVVLLEILNPFITLLVGLAMYDERGTFTIGGELFIPIVIIVITKYLRGIARRKGVDNSLPIPIKRLTEVNDGVVSIPRDKESEMLLLLGEYEDYLERTGRL